MEASNISAQGNFLCVFGAAHPQSQTSLHSGAGPPSTSGPGHSPFKAVARVRIPLGAWSRGAEGYVSLDEAQMLIALSVA
jgi:hypothetical protein